ncbi:MAG: phytochelatin synthase family protein, partial [Magnetospirillum sp.]|nr:phytochelatin synthase family protein [Magnetospirillum sp.]
DPPVSPETLLRMVGNGDWLAATRMGSDGVSFAELQLYLRESLDRMGLTAVRLYTFRPQGADQASLDRLRNLLAARQPADLVLASFDQGWLLGGISAGHVSPLGEYDSESGRVQILDVDPEHPTPYWVRDQDLLAAMTRPDSDDSTGDGLIMIRPPSRR